MATDTTPPTIAISSNKTALKAGDTALITFTLSEPATDFALSDVAVSGGTLSNFSGSGTSYTAIFTPAVNSTAAGSVSVGNFKFSDAAGNANEDGTDTNNRVSFTIDTIPPTVTISSNKTYLGYGESAQVTFTLSEPSPNFSATSISATNGFLGDFRGSDVTYTATFTPAETSTGFIQINAGMFTDVIGNPFAGQVNKLSIVPFDPTKANVAWTKLIGTASQDEGSALAIGTDGAIYIAGSTTSGIIDGQLNSGGYDAFLTKFNPDGSKAWVKLLGTATNDIASSVAIGEDGYIYLSGNTSGNLDGQIHIGYDAFIAKFNPDGSKVWTRLLGASTFGALESPKVTIGIDSSIYIAGSTSNISNLDGQTVTGSRDAFIAKFSSDGNKLWTKVLGAADNAVVRGLTTAPDGYIYMTGFTSDSLDGQTRNGGLDAFISKFNSDGSKFWTRLIGSSDTDIAFGITAARDSSIYISGYTWGSIQSTREDVFIAKIYSDGTKAWTRQLGSAGFRDDTAYDIEVDEKGSVYVAGYTEGDLDDQANNGQADAFVTKYDSSGNKIWTRLLGSSSSDHAYSIAIGRDNDIFLTGWTAGNLGDIVNNGSTDAFLTKLNLPDTSAPSISIASDNQSLYIGNSAVVSIKLSKPSTNFIASDIAVQGGFLSNFQGSGTVYTVTFTAGLSAPGGASVTVGSGKFSDASGIFNEDGSDANNKVTFTVANPTYSLTASGSSVNEGSSATFSLITTNIAPGFSLPYTVSGVSADDITGGLLTGTTTVDTTGKATITVPVAADKRTEGDETLTMTLQGQAASVTIKDTSVNTAPAAANAVGSTNEDTALTSTLPAATDVDGNAVTYAKATNPIHGTVSVSTSGSYTYTPTANYNGADSFSYTVNDGQGGSNTYTVSLTVTPVNDAPVAAAGTLSATEDIQASGTLSATDVDNTALTYSVVTQPAKGTVTLGANGAYTYTPAKDANGADSFTFRASDGALSSNTATVTITVAAVNDAPVVALPLPDQSTLSGSAYSYTFPNNAFTDVDSAVLTYSASLAASGLALPAWLSFNPATRAFSGTPGVSNVGAIDVRVTASDSSLAVSDVFSITISDRPVATSFQPADGAKAVAVGSNLLVTFNGPVQRGTGPITLKTADGKVVETFTANNATVSGSTLTLNPTADLSVFTKYVVELGSGAVKDAAGNGNAADSRYDFQTATQDGLYNFFVVAFAAAPGATYMSQLAEAVNFGLPLDQIVEIFTTKKQFTDVYPATMTNRELATQLVNNIVKNSASTATKTSAIDDIDAALGIGWSRGKMLYTVFGNLASKPLTDATWGNTAKQFQNQLAVARYFTEEMGVATENLATLRGVIGSVTADTDASTAEKIIQIIGSIPPGG